MTDEASRAFGQRAAAGTYTINTCLTCHAQSEPAVIACPECGSTDLVASAASGMGLLVSYTVTRRRIGSSAHDCPYGVCVVRLAEGPLAVGRLTLVDERPSADVGDPVKVDFVPLAGELVPIFSLASDDATS